MVWRELTVVQQAPQPAPHPDAAVPQLWPADGGNQCYVCECVLCIYRGLAIHVGIVRLFAIGNDVGTHLQC
jgi:hypothetical protein